MTADASSTPAASAPPMSRDAFLAAAIGELTEYWLGVRCARCLKSTLMPFKLLARKYGRRHRLQDVVVRLKCEQCKLPPATAWLVDYPIEHIQNGGRIAAWHVDLVP